MRSTPRRRSDASHSFRIESGRSTRRASFMRSRSSHMRPHLVNTSGRSPAGRSRSRRPTTSSEWPRPYTAAVYGLGHSEEVVGRLLRERPAGERPLVFTKCGLIWDERDRMKEARRVLRPDSIRKECEASLRRLGVERIDLYQFHWPDETGTLVEDSWQAMVRLVEEGKVRAAGVSNFAVPLLERCEAIRHVDSLQPPFSLIRREAAERVLPWCAEHETGVIVYSPMQSGLLTDNFTAGRGAALAPDDWRRKSPQYQQPALGKNLALRDALKPIARRHTTTDRKSTRLNS